MPIDTPPSVLKDLPVQLFANPPAWRRWLKSNHQRAPGIWLQLAKKSAATASVTYAEAIDEALCYGWIDGQKQPLDADYWLQKFTPRGARSIWSKINCGKVALLVESGRMQAAGLAQVERAKADGRWDAAYASARTALVPADFQAALDADPAARDFFATLDRINRYAVLFRIQTVKKADTRARRIAEFVVMLARHERIHAVARKA